ncbi:MAG TPA: hypothetical protein VE398_18315, partial [Acidobacteriota bacterium]|nr:hypothetical protein [Acidobacteriota bacterium]
LNFQSVIGNQLSCAGNIIMLGGISLTLGSAFVLIENDGGRTVVNHWWIFPAFALLCFALYRTSIRLVSSYLAKRQGVVSGLLSTRSSD